MINTLNESKSQENFISTKVEDNRSQSIIDDYRDDNEVRHNPNDEKRNDNVIQQVQSPNIVSKTKTSSSSLPKQRVFKSNPPSSSSFICIEKNNGVSTYIRQQFSNAPQTQDKIKDYFSQISLDLKNNFNSKRCISNSTSKKLSKKRRCNNINTNDEYISIEKHHTTNTAIAGYLRCYVEDFMLLEERERIIVLLPSTDSLWKEFKPTAFVQFGSTAFRVFNCSVLSSPYSQTLQAGMAICDIKKGFNEGRNGVIVSIEDPTSYINNTDHYQAKTKNDSSSSCITWRDVLNGRKDGIQVWRDTSKSDVYRNVSKLFDNRRRTEIGCKSLLSYLYEEMYGDRLQLFHLYSSYYKSRHKYIAAQSRTQQTSINDKVTTISKEIFNVPEEATLSGMNFNTLIERIDEIYKKAIQDTYTKFLPFGEPLISNETVISMLIDYMRTLPEHFNMMNEMLGFKDKQALTKNQHLTDVHYYNRKLLFMFLSQARSVNFQNLVHFGMVIPGAKYGRGLKGKSLVDSVYNGSSTTFQTMMSKLRIMSENMESKMKKKLGDMTRFVVMMDNNQKRLRTGLRLVCCMVKQYL